ncbi:PRD domain-containing protein [Clostridium paraputrificum]|uniref:PRD domain-containing protein n=1 Tax=Clostridium TaxID=1485 RepID=UPI0018A09B49|nr:MULTISPECIES: PRD domain-containing protein [Clostridium]MDB2077149.1 PRD domain-containing protein [Clostridium paraputrificum]MDB2077361.1 PRD domain-containing protein [Clostridium paraputrificum]MDU3412406.1 PRD domain-containing protein [Clostridium sp.]
MMRVLKVFNNNVVSIITEDKREGIVTGAGVGFGKKPGDLINESKVTQSFFIQNEKKKKFYSFLERTPIEYFEISEEIFCYAEKKLKKKMDASMMIALTDHISFAVERAKSGMIMPNLILNETQVLYKKEFEVGKWAIKHIKKKTNVKLSDGEAGYIAIHIIDATNGAPNNDAIKMIDTVKKVIDIIEKTYNIKIGTETLNYSRLVTHLKFFIQRISQDEEDDNDFVEKMYDNLTIMDKKIVKCIDDIASAIEEEYDYTSNQSEKVYLMMHILKIIRKN